MRAAVGIGLAPGATRNVVGAADDVGVGVVAVVGVREVGGRVTDAAAAASVVGLVCVVEAWARRVLVAPPILVVLALWRAAAPLVQPTKLAVLVVMPAQPPSASAASAATFVFVMSVCVVPLAPRACGGGC